MAASRKGRGQGGEGDLIREEKQSVPANVRSLPRLLSYRSKDISLNTFLVRRFGEELEDILPVEMFAGVYRLFLRGNCRIRPRVFCQHI